MSNREQEPPNPGASPDQETDTPSSQGPSLVLLYSLLGLALLAAIGFALLVVLPFYHRR